MTRRGWVLFVVMSVVWGLPYLMIKVAVAGVSAPVLVFVWVAVAALTWPAALPSGRVLAALAGLALLCTALAFVVFFELIREVGPGRTTVITYINPAVAVVAGVAVLGEPLTVPIVVAFGLILAGSALATSKDAAPGPLPAPAGQA